MSATSAYEHTSFDIVVIGGGAAGLVASICAAWKCQSLHLPAHIALFEAQDRVGRSILATGNGRCNFSNAHISSDVYWNASFVQEVFSALENSAFWKPLCEKDHPAAQNAVLALLSCLGLCWREEAQGRLFPVTGKASTVLDVLRTSAAALGVQECCNKRVLSVEAPRALGKPYTLRMADGAFGRAHVVVCAVGGSVAREFLPKDVPYIPEHSLLGPLKTETSIVRTLDNIRIRCGAALEHNGERVAYERGEVLFRKYGLSGIAIFNLSRFAQPGDIVSLDVCPALEESELEAHLSKRAAMFQALYDKEASCQDVLRGVVLPLVAAALLKTSDLACDALASPDNMKRLSSVMKHFDVVVEGVGDSKQCQVHRGGFCCENFVAATLESKQYAGLFAAGEMLDVDAPCGGYNLHWAWASGAVAGMSAAEFLAQTEHASHSAGGLYV